MRASKTKWPFVIEKKLLRRAKCRATIAVAFACERCLFLPMPTTPGKKFRADLSSLEICLARRSIRI